MSSRAHAYSEPEPKGFTVPANPADPVGGGPEASANALSQDQPGDVMVLPHDEHTLVILYGDIDQRISQDLEEAGRFCLHPARKTIIDVRKMTMMDSVGLSFIIRLGAGLQAAGTYLRLQGPSRRTAELITLVGADSLMTWLPDQTKPDLI